MVKPLLQLRFMWYEINLLINKRLWRWLTVWFSGGAGVIISYRLDRFLYLFFGRRYTIIRIFFIPVFVLIGAITEKHEIHYRADIGKGLKILHPRLGVVVSSHAICGESLVLTGGNCIGGRKSLKDGDLVIGSGVSLGANAVVLGPVRVGDYCRIGAGAVVVADAPNNATLVGVPARAIQWSAVEASSTV